MKQRNKTSNISQIKEELKRRLIAMRYSKESIYTYLKVFEWVDEFLTGYGENDYTKEAGQRFLAEYILQAHHNPNYFPNARVLIHRMDEILDGKIFAPRFCEPKYEFCE